MQIAGDCARAEATRALADERLRITGIGQIAEPFEVVEQRVDFVGRNAARAEPLRKLGRGCNRAARAGAAP